MIFILDSQKFEIDVFSSKTLKKILHRILENTLKNFFGILEGGKRELYNQNNTTTQKAILNATTVKNHTHIAPFLPLLSLSPYQTIFFFT